MNIKLELDCVPVNELPNLLNCLCKMNVIHLANMDEEDGKGGYSDVIKIRQSEAKALKGLLNENLNLLCNLKNSLIKSKIVTTDNIKLVQEYNINLEIKDSIEYMKDNIKDSEQDCIAIIGEILIKLLGIDDGYEFNHWLKDNIYDYIKIFTDFVIMPVDNLTVE